MPSDNIAEFRRALSSSKKILVLSGAGLSAPSGISTFRGSGGLWRKHDAASVATPAAFAENQSRVWQFFHYRREQVRNAAPNPGHYVLARLAIPSIRHKLAPNSELTHITQNVDGLCTRALNETVVAFGKGEQPGEIIEMHGRLFDVVCTAHDCNFRETNYKSPICPALGGTENFMQDGAPEPIIRRVDLPHCPDCGQLCRPGVVWFGERPHRIHEVLALADEADLCIIVGTSAVIQPASKIGSRVKEHGGRVAVFNIEPSNHSDEADFLFLGPCEIRLQEVLGV
ncbi:DHS-like NAD/FAD-binding domain-containing protein [Flammula alnicola]|nr:DHS-like NAD/FAD-binding domain-containing protein [Flammula alnicola]